MDSQFELLFLGSGTSVGVPLIGCHCEVCTSSDPHDKRTRPSVLITVGGQRVLVDTTPELRIQCVANGIDMVDAVVYTHPHADHIMGLDDLRRFNALSGSSLDIWADAVTAASLKRCFYYAFDGPVGELQIFRPNLVHRVIDGPFEVGSATWTPVPLIHGRGRVSGYRIGPLAYCTDVSEIPESSYELLKGLEVLVLGALSHVRHPSHFNLEEAVDAATRIGAERTFFTHIGHALGHEATNRMLAPNIRLAYDGLKITGG